MKFTAALSLAIAPVALAKSVHNAYPVRRDPSKAAAHGGAAFGVASSKGVDAIGVDAVVIEQNIGLDLGTIEEVVVIWLNQGGGTPTTTFNTEQTMTQTMPGTTTTGAGGGATHTVTVGGPSGLVYQPDTISANIGDVVIFTFLSQNHTATQSAFTTPCERLSGGMDSGFQPNLNNSVNPPPQVAMQVQVSTPLWFYCRQKGHCGKGMTFSINPTAAKTQALFQEMAIAQNGTGSGSTITGSGNGTTGSGSSSVAAGPSLTATLGGGSGSTATPVASSGPTTGTGTVNPDGSCICAVVCAAGSLPAVNAQGLGGFGGAGGALPSSMVAVR